MMPSLPPSKWSKPLMITTPSPPNSLPTPKYLQISQHPFVAQYPIPIGKLSPLKANTRYQVTVYTSANGSDSPESKAIQIMTPPAQFYQIPHYKPLSPRNIEQIIDEQYNEIILMWSLPPNTFGNNIHYIILDLPQQPQYQ